MRPTWLSGVAKKAYYLHLDDVLKNNTASHTLKAQETPGVPQHPKSNRNMITSFDPSPHNCTIHGDPTLYALPVRLAFYLPTLSGILAVFFGASTQFRANQRAISVISLAIFIHLISNVTSNSLALLEWIIVYFLVLALPSGIAMNGYIKEDKWSALLQFTVLFAGLCALPWLAWKKAQQGREGKEDCRVRMFFYAYFDMYNKRWIKALKGVTIISEVLIGGFLLFVFSGWQIWKEGPKKKREWGGRRNVRNPEAEREKKKEAVQEKPRRRLACWLVFTSAHLIGFVEMIIRGNKIVMAEWRWLDTNQLTPFLVGLFTLLSTVFGIVVDKRRKIKEKKTQDYRPVVLEPVVVEAEGGIQEFTVDEIRVGTFKRFIVEHLTNTENIPIILLQGAKLLDRLVSWNRKPETCTTMKMLLSAIH
ncbi:uncharacterized protein BDR25DRAFT_358962 [Lindgomyces ingoldianus]|uniref:Uncharacterized protein n=1 Tax=Lindgomyces ingoldianus TaxID=673940 RepID=A0ACB6QKR7_9PLEO|nr:uncharacterized protein BDR25DRAFT_358962 [Lindgomyces ingoldianus]KAF2466902.1 hypothetical protein BDR25DRAFT_358962 [Lindgomyces ingoldianus]